MTESRRAPLYPVFVVIPQAATRLASLSTLLAPLAVSASSARVTGVDVYYRAVSDVALLALRFDARFTTGALVDQITNDAARVGGGVLDPGRLSDDARRRFFQTYLPSFDVRILQLESPTAALRALSDHLDGDSVLIEEATPAMLDVRFRRGDSWQLARVRSLSKDGISLATGAPPRRGDVVDLEISAGTVTLVARGAVVGVTSPEVASVLGAAGFGARFLLGEDGERATLDRLLAMFGDGTVPSLTPPPRRRESRYPVRWPVVVNSARGKAKLSALDVSRHGLFVAVDPAAPTLSRSVVQVLVPVDRGEEDPVRAHARVARAIPEDVARARGLAAGYGLELTSLSPEDEPRFAAFVARIGRRAEKSVVVGASPGRVGAICAELLSAGYTAFAAPDPTTLLARAAAPSCTPDLVVLDSSLSDEHPRAMDAAWRALNVRTVRVLTLDGDTPRAARERADAELL